MKDEDVWFEPKRIGYGAGLPVAWQGWAVMGAYFVVLGLAMAALLPRHTGIFLAVTAIATAGLMVVAARHTRGGWKWRNGRE